MKGKRRTIVTLSFLAMMIALTIMQSHFNEKIKVYSSIDNDVSAIILDSNPGLIVLPCCDYMPGDSSSPGNRSS